MIHYYFGSKEGLYKAVLGMAEPLSKPGTTRAATAA